MEISMTEDARFRESQDDAFHEFENVLRYVLPPEVFQ